MDRNDIYLSILAIWFGLFYTIVKYKLRTPKCVVKPFV